ncbi:hypothetical protein TIFTF001_036157 [Ficus carica]|uniref:Uncharacterized protein n=1 Tax=Ficus carica TaxID=3494 RepID=A0AA88E3S7_FICCA|nr:hypothetical protein TIFTF001_036152 [Ficus carica]GMN67095.1 hypothetical protein TIFTF001_036157 [Ficus carica]
MFPAYSTATKPWTSQPARTSRVLTTLLLSAHRAPGDLSVGGVREHNANLCRQKFSSGTSKA